MRVKPKEVLVNLPAAHLFDEPWEIASFAASINTVLHGKIKVKVEELGTLGGKYVGLFYLNRYDEYHQIRDEFVRMIEDEMIMNHMNHTSPEPYVPSTPPPSSLSEEYDPNFGDDKLCECGHTYYRHFDTYDHMYPVGCKYCFVLADNYTEGNCAGFKEKK